MNEKPQPNILEIAERWFMAIIEFLFCYALIGGFLTLISPYQEHSLEEFIFVVGIAVPCSIWIVQTYHSQRRKQERRAEQNVQKPDETTEAE